MLDFKSISDVTEMMSRRSGQEPPVAHRGETVRAAVDHAVAVGAQQDQVGGLSLGLTGGVQRHDVVDCVELLRTEKQEGPDRIDRSKPSACEKHLSG